MSIHTALTLTYLFCVAGSITALVVALRRRQEPSPRPAHGPGQLAPIHTADMRAILMTAAQLAALCHQPSERLVDGAT